jgi:hypothetical protein
MKLELKRKTKSCESLVCSCVKELPTLVPLVMARARVSTALKPELANFTQHRCASESIGKLPSILYISIKNLVRAMHPDAHLHHFNAEFDISDFAIERSSYTAIVHFLPAIVGHELEFHV